jgi:O-antigen/teichoic acid export membrane protein
MLHRLLPPTAARLARESLQLVGGYGMGLVLGLVGSILLARGLGDEGRGVYAWLLTLQGLGIQLASVVTYQAARQLAAKHPEKMWPKLIGTVSCLSVAGIFLALPVLVYGVLEPHIGQHHRGLLVLLFIVAPVYAMAVGWSGIFLTNTTWIRTLIYSVGLKSIALVGIVVLVLFKILTLTTAIWLQIVAILWFAALIVILVRIPLQKWEFDWVFLQKIRNNLGVNWLVGLFLFALPKLATVQLGASGQLAATGHFAVALTLFEAALNIPTLAASVLITHFTRHSSGNIGRAKATWALAGSMGIAAVVGGLLAPWLIPFLFGAGFTNSVQPFQILMICLVLASLHQAWLSQLISQEHKIAQVVPALTACVVVLAAGGWFIPAGAAIGAALATLLGYVILVVGTYLLKPK